ncbi:hypothetical protein TrRE_jg2751 [Triparma retinervis]|uniref:Uncharacterized protein n=1 Tax=Triparma retinervis TaxID=2557542 RepID=A0A9W7CF94_9STRA|nr:hypothetical protein TrRE_jg2751 [Triparma retinervis]
MPAFEHAAEPRAITGKAKYRDDMLLPTNIMKDPRVAKGSTYSAHHKKVKAEAQALLSKSMGRGGEVGKERRRPKKKKSIYDYKPKEAGDNALDLAPHLVEQVAPIAVATVNTQTAQFEARPPSPEFVPMKTGIDMTTQLSDEVFDFDIEVGPLLQVIVGKTMEQALLEVEGEAELKALENECGRLGDEKKAEEERIRQMDLEAARVWKEKKEKVEAEIAFAKAQDEVRAKVAAVRCMKQILPNMLGEVYQGKVDRGEWVENDIASAFLPWLIKSVEENIEGKRRGSELLDDVIVFSLEKAKSMEKAAREAEEQRLKELSSAAARLRAARVGKVKINITAGSVGLAADKVVGPLDITGSDTVRDLEDKIKAWLTDEGITFEAGESGFLQLGNSVKQRLR